MPVFGMPASPGPGPFRMYPSANPGPYPGAMETEHNKAVFSGMHEIRARLSAAIDRCEYVALSERLMGYPESAREYDDTAEELKDVKAWIDKYMHSLLQLA